MVNVNNAQNFYSIYDTLSGMNPRRDLITVELKTISLFKQFIERVKSFIYGKNKTELRRENIDMWDVAKKMKEFVDANRTYLETQAGNAKMETNHPFRKLVKNLEAIQNRFIAKQGSGVRSTKPYNDLNGSLITLYHMLEERAGQV